MVGRARALSAHREVVRCGQEVVLKIGVLLFWRPLMLSALS